MAKSKNRGWGLVPADPGSHPTSVASLKARSSCTPNALITVGDLERLMKTYESKVFSLSINDNGDKFYFRNSGEKDVILSVTYYISKDRAVAIYINVPHKNVTDHLKDVATVRLQQNKMPLEEFLELISGVVNAVLYT